MKNPLMNIRAEKRRHSSTSSANQCGPCAAKLCAGGYQAAQGAAWRVKIRIIRLPQRLGLNGRRPSVCKCVLVFPAVIYLDANRTSPTLRSFVFCFRQPATPQNKEIFSNTSSFWDLRSCFWVWYTLFIGRTEPWYKSNEPRKCDFLTMGRIDSYEAWSVRFSGSDRHANWFWRFFWWI